MKRDEHGDRMKYYESLETQKALMRGLTIYARLDGRGFSKFTKPFKYPHDAELREVFTLVSKALMKEFGCVLAFHQSDEISLLIAHETEHGVNTSPLMFGGKIQKLCSSMSAFCTGYFIKYALGLMPEHKEHILNNPPTFDCRIFNVPTLSEGINQFVWREKDATKNSVSMLARKHFSHKELHRKSSNEMIYLLEQKGVFWAEMPSEFKRGTYIGKVQVQRNGVLRTQAQELNIPPITKIQNKIGVLLHSEEPVFYEI